MQDAHCSLSDACSPGQWVAQFSAPIQHADIGHITLPHPAPHLQRSRRAFDHWRIRPLPTAPFPELRDRDYLEVI